MAAVEIRPERLHLLGCALAGAADRIAVLRGAAIDAMYPIGRDVGSGVHALRLTEATLRERSADVMRRAAEIVRSQERALAEQATLAAIRQDFDDHDFVPDAYYDALSFEDKVSYYFVSQMGAAGWVVPAQWSSWSLAQRVEYFDDHFDDIRCANARQPFVCEHQVGLLQIFGAIAMVAGAVADVAAVPGVIAPSVGFVARAPAITGLKRALFWIDDAATADYPPSRPAPPPALVEAKRAVKE